MHHKAESHINKILIRDELLFDMDVGNGWTVTDVWFDHDIPVEKIDCIKVKFERVKGDCPSHCDNCPDCIYHDFIFGCRYPRQTERSE